MNSRPNDGKRERSELVFLGNLNGVSDRVAHRKFGWLKEKVDTDNVDNAAKGQFSGTRQYGTAQGERVVPFELVKWFDAASKHNSLRYAAER